MNLSLTKQQALALKEHLWGPSATDSILAEIYEKLADKLSPQEVSPGASFPAHTIR